MLNKNDFVIQRINKIDGFVDYWFKVENESYEDIWNRIPKDQGMGDMGQIVYCNDKGDSILGIEINYIFNKEVKICNFNDVKQLLIEIIKYLDESNVKTTSELY